jgi:hypothetical protein
MERDIVLQNGRTNQVSRSFLIMTHSSGSTQASDRTDDGLIARNNRWNVARLSAFVPAESDANYRETMPILQQRCYNSNSITDATFLLGVVKY